MQQIEQRIVILVAGGNDLDGDLIDRQRVGGAMFSLGSYVNVGLEVPIVAVTQLAFRSKIRTKIASVVTANRRLKHLIEQVGHNSLMYLKIKGIKQTTVNPYLHDGVHLNWKSGMKFFSHCMKKAETNY